MLHPLTTWSLGPLTVSVQLLFLMLSGLVGLTIVSIYFKRLAVEEREAIVDKITLAFISWILVFKLWPFVLEPGMVTDMRNVIYFSGGPWAVEAATALSFGILLYFYIRNKWPFKMWEGMLVGVFAALIFHSLFVREVGALSPWMIGFDVGGETVHPINFYYVWLYSIALAGAAIFFNKNTIYGRSIYLVISLGVIYFLIAPFQA
ncbi:hypothetical protein [Salipaludibacillus daqingensis]|uniref:hypothetical protein n=1 Tax=Salipaludibacillus daqingensis TaxID=3041001 RepID=UPI0024751824|nr:hypothetical protein [Salipaludibacillus daqingensis]